MLQVRMHCFYFMMNRLISEVQWCLEHSFNSQQMRMCEDGLAIRTK
jgi:hypothetical protein